MKRRLGWLLPAILALGVVAGSVVAWRVETAAPSPGERGPASSLVTPVLSVRRVPTVVAAPIAERRLLTDLGDLVRFLPSSSCLVVDGPELRFDHRGDEPVVPASTQKILIATAALDVLDHEARLRTTAVAAEAPEGGVVRGDLTLVGGGDPLLATADYMSRFRRQPQVFTDLGDLASAIAGAGVRRIDGSVVGDESRYDRQRYLPSWPSRYVEQDSIGPASALSVNDGFARYPTEKDPTTELEPAADPAVEAATVLTRLLEAHGVAVSGPPRWGSAPLDATEIAALESLPLIDLVGQLLRESDNETAELLLKELGRTEQTPSTSGGRPVVSDAIDDDGARVVDGSGLSVDNRVTCDLLVGLLERPSTGDLIRDRLPVAGESGTLAERFEGTVLDAVLRAKTGSLTSVTALAGFVEDDDPALPFALIVNVAPGSPVPAAVADLQLQVAEVLAAWPRVPDLAALGPVTEDG